MKKAYVRDHERAQEERRRKRQRGRKERKIQER